MIERCLVCLLALIALAVAGLVYVVGRVWG